MLAHRMLIGSAQFPYINAGFQWTQSTDTVVRLGEGIGKLRSDFDNYWPWAGMRRCLVLNNGTVNYYLSPTDSSKKANGTAANLDGTDGQVMVEIPKFYYKSANPSANVYEYYVSQYPSIGYSVHPAFVRNGVEKNCIYFSAFEGFYSSTDGAMRSVSAVVPSTNNGTSDGGLSPIAAYPNGGGFNGGDIRNCRYWANQRGSGWGIQDFLTTSAIQLLYMVEYANWNTQSTIGKGVVDKAGGTNNNANKTGATVSLGNTSGRESGTDGLTSVSYRGVENFWGNIWKWVDGCNFNSGGDYGIYVADNGFESDKFTSPYVKIGTFPSTGSAWGSISNISYATGYSFFPSAVSGTSYASHLYDGLYSVTTVTRVALFGGGWAYGLPCGGFCWILANASDVVDPSSGARLLLIP